MATQQPPAIPPRPARARSPQPAPSSIPAIPPRPSRLSRTAEPEQEPDPEPTPISTETELQQPQPVSGRPAPVPRTSSASSSAAPSIYKFDSSETATKDASGIPQIGRRVPMYPNAGDVQAPSPTATPSSGKKKHVYREEWEMDEGVYGQHKTRTPYCMSSVDLNATVAHADSPGVGAHVDVEGVPDEELGYLASEHYTKALSRSESPVSTRGGSKNDSQTSTAAGSERGTPTDDDGNVIHLDDPAHGTGYYRRGNLDYDLDHPVPERPVSTTGDSEEEPEEHSIIAEDEAAKRQKSQYMQAAISPPASRASRSRPRSIKNFKEEDDNKEPIPTLDTSRFPPSRASLRTPYENLSPTDEDAKPLFPESEDEGESEPKNKAVDKLKRPVLSEQRFPSNDVWEEAPDHAHLQATVDAPPAPTSAEDNYHPDADAKQRRSSGPELQYVKGQPHHHYEPGDEQELLEKPYDYRTDQSGIPEDERLRKLLKEANSDNSVTMVNGQKVTRRKFPSNDIWEENPPSLDLQATIEPSPVPDKDRATTGDSSAMPADDDNARPTTGAPIDTKQTAAATQLPGPPSIPARPHRVPAPAVPERPKPKPKPTVLARAPSTDDTPKTEQQQKPKPPVPARSGGKIAALKAGLGDLENKLKFGPFGAPPQKKEEPKEESKEPQQLEDVRKSRARGPRGRKLPTAKPAEEKPAEAAVATEGPKIEIAGIWTVYKIDEDLDAVVVGPLDDEPKPSEASKAPVTTALPGVDSTGATASVAATEEASPEATDKTPAAAEGNPTVIPSDEHPEDAFEETEEGPKTPGPSRSGTLVGDFKRGEMEDPMKVAEEGVEERKEQEG